MTTTSEGPKLDWMAPGDLVEHPLNREFPTRGKEWDGFVESIRRRGVVSPLVVRELEDGRRQVIAGHRRRRAAMACESKWVPCVVRVGMDDREALELVLIENLEKVDLNAVEEARAVRGMLEELDMTPEEVSERIHRSVEWVSSRQRLLDLGDEVLAAVRRPKDEPEHLTMGTVREILRVPEEWRGEAVQLVLHNGFEDGALRAEQAKEVLRRCLVEPKAAEQEWETKKGDLAKAWRKRLAEQCMQGTREDLLVKAGRYGDRVRGGVDAEALVPLGDVLPDAPEVPGGLRWLHLAVRHGAAVTIEPPERSGPGNPRAEDAEESRAVVDPVLVRAAEESLAEHVARGGEVEEGAWLVTRASRVSVERGARSAEQEKGDEPPAAAGEEGEEGEEVIEQRVESRAWIDLGKVRALEQALAADGDDLLKDLEGVVPDVMRVQLGLCDAQAKQMALEVCKWVVGLRCGESVE